MRATIVSAWIPTILTSTLAAGACAAAPTSPDLVARGKYLAAAGDCMACHTAKGAEPFAGGRLIETPFGAMASPNITPDKATGIGSWTDAQFYRAMHEGIGRRGEYLYPVMPFPWYSQVTPDDVAAIKAYLFSLAPVNKPRAPDHLRFPYSVRESLLAWRAAFFKPATFKPDATQGEEANRGAYLVNGLAHCGECHNARPVAGTSSFRKSLQGGPIDNWYAPNITSDLHDGIGAWTTEQIATFLKTGSAPGGGVALGPMAETIHSLSALTDADLKAIAVYLKTTPAAKGASERTAPIYQGAGARGASTCLNYCASCHGLDGRGLPNAVPKLVGNGAVTADGPQNVISVVLGGLAARDTYGPMPPIGAAMSDEEVAEVSNYVRQLGGNAAPATAQAGMVATLRNSVDSPLNPAPSSACPAVVPAVAKAIADPRTGLAGELHDLTEANMYQRTQLMVAALHKTAPRASQADVVNGLTAAYCPIVRDAAQSNRNAHALRLGHFSQMVYTQLHSSAQSTRAR